MNIPINNTPSQRQTIIETFPITASMDTSSANQQELQSILNHIKKELGKIQAQDLAQIPTIKTSSFDKVINEELRALYKNKSFFNNMTQNIRELTNTDNKLAFFNLVLDAAKATNEQHFHSPQLAENLNKLQQAVTTNPNNLEQRQIGDKQIIDSLINISIAFNTKPEILKSLMQPAQVDNYGKKLGSLIKTLIQNNKNIPNEVFNKSIQSQLTGNSNDILFSKPVASFIKHISEKILPEINQGKLNQIVQKAQTGIENITKEIFDFLNEFRTGVEGNLKNMIPHK